MPGLRAMVLAAGLGERMRPLTNSLPKPLLPVANKPVLGYVLEHLSRHGFTEVIANLHYRPEEMVDHFGGGTQYGVNLTYSYEEQLLGAAGGVKRCLEFFEEETFLVTGADDLTTIDLSALLLAHREVGALASIALVEVEQTSEYGIVVTDEEGHIARFVEKPKGKAPSKLANTQIYLFESEILDFIPPEQFCDFGYNVFPALVEAGVPFFGFQVEGYWRDIGSIKDYLDAQVDVLEGRLGGSVPGDQIAPGIWTGADCSVDTSARLTAPLLLGDRCVVGAKARLGGGVCIGEDAVIGESAAISQSVVWSGVEVPPASRLKQCVVTPDGVVHQ
jgi:NDP-sugar pyrophosphorylase family protein